MSTEAMKVSVDERVQTITNSILFVGSYSGDEDAPARVTPEGIAMISDVVARIVNDAEAKVERDRALRKVMSDAHYASVATEHAHVYHGCAKSAQCKACVRGANVDCWPTAESSEEDTMESVLTDVDPTCHF